MAGLNSLPDIFAVDWACNALDETSANSAARISSFFMIMSLSALFPVLPAIRDEINASYSQIAFFVATVGVVRVFGALPSGWMADRFNRKIILVASGCLNIAGLIVLSIAHNIYQLIASRILITLGRCFQSEDPSAAPTYPQDDIFFKSLLFQLCIL